MKDYTKNPELSTSDHPVSGKSVSAKSAELVMVDGTAYATVRQVTDALGLHLSTVRRRADSEAWMFQEQPFRGGPRRLYPVAQLPEPVKQAVLALLLRSAPGPIVSAEEPQAPTRTDAPPLTALSKWQRDRMIARLALLHEEDRMAPVIGREKARRKLVALAEAGSLRPELQAMIPTANARSGRDGKRSLSRRTLCRWRKELLEGGQAAVAPKAPTITIPAWAPDFLKHYQVPQKVSVPQALERMRRELGEKAKIPSEWAVYRFLKKMSTVDRERGRMGPQALRSLRPFRLRSTANLWPGDVYTMDGHSFKAEVAHPGHGRPFKPEITSVLDVATRRAVGFSVALSESGLAVADGVRDAVLTGGIPAILYVDNGSGYENELMNDELTGLMARLGIEKHNSIAWNSQARGIIERSHPSVWERGAKELATYQGKGMDREAKQNVYKITRKDIKEFGKSRLLIAWPDFLTWCQAQADAYNDRPQRGLPKITDPATGRRRHQTPNEAWQAAIEEGWEPVTVNAEEANDLFRPHQRRTIRRGTVSLFGNQYFHPDLEHHNGEPALVACEPHDGTRVWVKTLEEQLICVAEFEANKTDYFARSAVDHAADGRRKRREKAKQVQLEEIREEHEGGAALIEQPSELSEHDKALAEAKFNELNARAETVVSLPKAPNGRPMFRTDAEKYQWLRAHPDQFNADDSRWLDWFKTTSEYRLLFADDEDFEVAAGQ